MMKSGWNITSTSTKDYIDCIKIASRLVEFADSTGFSIADNSVPQQFAKRVDHRSKMVCT